MKTSYSMVTPSHTNVCNETFAALSDEGILLDFNEGADLGISPLFCSRVEIHQMGFKLSSSTQDNVRRDWHDVRLKAVLSERKPPFGWSAL